MISARTRPERGAGLANSIRLEVKLVVISVTVTDPFGAPVSGLPKEAFHVFEDGIQQQVSYFATEDAPISLGVVFDASGSMEHKLDKSRQAVSEFFKTSMPGDEYFLLEFNNAPKILCNFTTDQKEIEGALVSLRPKGWTALFDAVYLAIHKMKYARNPRKALLILSDGGDNYSRYSEAEIRNRVREADTCIYTIGILGAGISKRNARLLRELAEETGGRFSPVTKMRELPEAVAKISAALRNQYVLGFSSNNLQNDGRYRKVEVRLVQPAKAPRLHASWRTGYYAPAGQ